MHKNNQLCGAMQEILHDQETRLIDCSDDVTGIEDPKQVDLSKNAILAASSRGRQ